ncbi:hypothetical protein TRIUR3_17847 [Triticum urartu]|uniref:UspA domain-containing protein n=1 Tax=Triticum urartu TaxID=4572 RepID=M7ZWU7_TRIUA|nr:hypothetical protein TRIUR3_17847 [Triticum urartu]
METVEEDVEEYSWREVVLPRLIPVVPHAAPELERETGERRRGRDLLARGVQNDLVYNKSQELMDELAVEAFKESLVHTKARIVEGDAGKVICREAERLKPAAVVIGTRGRSLIQRYLTPKPQFSDICGKL